MFSVLRQKYRAGGRWGGGPVLSIHIGSQVPAVTLAAIGDGLSQDSEIRYIHRYTLEEYAIPTLGIFF